MGCMGGGGDTSIKDTEDKKALAEWGALQYQSYKTLWEPAEENLFKELARNETADRQNFVENKASGDVSTALSDSMVQTRKQLNASGLNPNSGKYIEAIDGVSDAQESAGLSALSAANINLEDKKLNDVSNAIAMGKGQETQASVGLSQIASNATGDSIAEAKSTVDENLSQQALVGTAAGLTAMQYGSK